MRSMETPISLYFHRILQWIVSFRITHVDCIPYARGTLEILEYIASPLFLDGLEAFILSLTPPIKTLSQSSSYIVVLNDLSIGFCMLPIDSI